MKMLMVVLALAGVAAAASAGTGHDMDGHSGHMAMEEITPAASAPFVVVDSNLEALNAELAASHGIQVEGIRLTADGTMLDYRYKVVDADSAASLHGQLINPHLRREGSDLKFEVPFAAKVGSLKQSSKAPVEGRTYVILFANPGRSVHSGDHVSIEQADMMIVGLPVE